MRCGSASLGYCEHRGGSWSGRGIRGGCDLSTAVVGP